jgi:hypothetical protein
VVRGSRGEAEGEKGTGEAKEPPQESPAKRPRMGTQENLQDKRPFLSGELVVSGRAPSEGALGGRVEEAGVAARSEGSFPRTGVERHDPVEMFKATRPIEGEQVIAGFGRDEKGRGGRLEEPLRLRTIAP